GGAGLPFVLMPSFTDDPFPGCSFSHRGAYLFNDIIKARGRSQVEPHLVIADSHYVTMALNEARRHNSSLQVDNFGLITDILFTGFAFSCKSDSAVTNSDAFDNAIVIINRIDFAAVNNEVGALRRGTSDCNQQRQHHKNGL